MRGQRGSLPSLPALLLAPPPNHLLLVGAGAEAWHCPGGLANPRSLLLAGLHSKNSHVMIPWWPALAQEACAEV